MSTDTQKLDKVLERLDAMAIEIEALRRERERSDELWDELMPIAKEVLGKTTEQFDDLDRRGYFAFGRALASVADRIVKNYSPADVEQLADSIVQILDTVRAVTQPEVMELAADAAAAAKDVDHVEPLGVFGLARATRSPDVGRGIAVMVEVLRRVGKGVGAASQKAADKASRQDKLRAILGPKRNRALGVERQLPAPRAAAKPAEARPAPSKPTTAPACAVPSTKAPVAATVLDGIAYTADGHLVDPAAWTRPLGEAIAAAQHVELTPAHWQIIEAAQKDFADKKVTPNIRRLTQVANLGTKELYALFPKAPARTIAKIAGLPKPAGCL